MELARRRHDRGITPSFDPRLVRTASGTKTPTIDLTRMSVSPTVASTGRPPPPLSLLHNASLFFDFDGTLVDLAERPDTIIVDGRLRSLLHTLDHLTGGRVAIVSGRSVAQIRGFLSDPKIAVSGSHGVELEWPDGRRNTPDAPDWLSPVAARMAALARKWPGMVIEEKPFGVALHYRQVPHAEADCHRLAATLAAEHDIDVQGGKMMVELRVPGANKGDAVRALMADPAMAGTIPLFFGDDLTDEPAFKAAAAFGGAGILVGDERESAARYRVSGVAETLAWLGSAVATA